VLFSLISAARYLFCTSLAVVLSHDFVLLLVSLLNSGHQPSLFVSFPSSSSSRQHLQWIEESNQQTTLCQRERERERGRESEKAVGDGFSDGSASDVISASAAASNSPSQSPGDDDDSEEDETRKRCRWRLRRRPALWALGITYTNCNDHCHKKKITFISFPNFR
jgi:hypothetical protein